MQQNKSYSSCSIALSFSFRTNKLRVLIFDIKESLSELFDYLKHISSLSFESIIISATALKLQIERFNEIIKSCQTQLYDIETLIEMRQFNHTFECNHTRTKNWRILNLIDVTRNLSSFLSRFAFLKLQAKIEVDLVRQMQLFVEFLKSELKRMKEAKSKIDNQRDILFKLEQSVSWYLDIQTRCRYFIERT